MYKSAIALGKQDKLFHEAIRRAIMGLPGARARWDLRRKYGMSDAQLRKAIQDEMDCFGDLLRCSYLRNHNEGRYLYPF